MTYDTIKRILFRLNPQLAHRIVMKNLDWFTIFGFHEQLAPTPPEDPIRVMGLRFPNSVGLAAGFDANGECVNALGAFGFGHIEVGTFSAKPVARKQAVSLLRQNDSFVFRRKAIYPNEGIDRGLVNLKSADGFHLRGGILGINIGEDALSKTFFDDIACCLRKAYRRGDYFVLNAVGLSGDQTVKAVKTLIAERNKLLSESDLSQKPIAVKIAPELNTDALRYLLDALVLAGTNGLIVVGEKQDADPAFLLSGSVLSAPATESLFQVTNHLKNAIPVIASGGILSSSEAVSRLQAGAKLVQLFSGFVDQGPLLVTQCVRAAQQQRQKNL